MYGLSVRLAVGLFVCLYECMVAAQFNSTNAQRKPAADIFWQNNISLKKEKTI